MKIKILTYLIIVCCFGQVFSQELRMMPREREQTNPFLIGFEAEDLKEQSSFTLIQLGVDLYNLQIANLEIGAVSFGMNSRLEEELSYENNTYDYTGFYYLDLGVNYMINNFSIGLSIENFLNLDNDNFSIDPIIEQSNGIINDYYFSHESDTLISMTFSYNF